MLSTLLNAARNANPLIGRGYFLGTRLIKPNSLNLIPKRNYFISTLSSKTYEGATGNIGDFDTTATLPSGSFNSFKDLINKFTGKPNEKEKALKTFMSSINTATDIVDHKVKELGGGTVLFLGQEYLFCLIQMMTGAYKPLPLTSNEAKSVFDNLEQLSNKYQDCYVSCGSVLYESPINEFQQIYIPKDEQSIQEPRNDGSIVEIKHKSFENSEGNLHVQNEVRFYKGGKKFFSYLKNTDFQELINAKKGSIYVPGDKIGITEILDKETGKKVRVALEVCFDHNQGILKKNWPENQEKPQVQAILSASVALKPENIIVRENGLVVHVDLQEESHLYVWSNGSLNPIKSVYKQTIDGNFNLEIYNVSNNATDNEEKL